MKTHLVYSEEGLSLTRHFESCRLKAYWDELGEVWTIAWGHTRNVQRGDVCTQDQANRWLAEDILEVATPINHHSAVQLTQGQFDALVDFAYNLSYPALRGSTLWRMVQQNNTIGAALQFERWIYAKGKKVAGLLRRRRAEKLIFQGEAFESADKDVEH